MVKQELTPPLASTVLPCSSHCHRSVLRVPAAETMGMAVPTVSVSGHKCHSLLYIRRGTSGENLL